tara:strand:- start:549 stop:1874 length:1326 start_codon:yes stop_codon:yes gene_type:complete
MDKIKSSFCNLSPLPLFWQSLDNKMPGQMLEKVVFLNDGILSVDGQEIILESKVNILAYGKASRLMYETAKKIVGPEYFGRGILVTHENINEISIDPLKEKFLMSTHPFISELSAIAGEEVKQFVQKGEKLDVLLVLISGGGSAMVSLPIEEISLEDKIEFISDIMHASVPEREVNILKKALSQIKGGKLAELSTTDLIVNCILSDERNHEVSAISSGMTVCNDLVNPLDVMDQYSLWNFANERISKALRNHGEKRNIGCENKFINSIIGSREDLIGELCRSANQFGFDTVHVLDTIHSCSPIEAVSLLVSEFESCYEKAEKGKHLVISTGEVQVKVDTSKPSKGGRNQHLIALLMLNFYPTYDFFICAIATDGVDYLDGVHGAFYTKEHINMVNEKKEFISDLVNKSNSFEIHKMIGSLLMGPKTGTNMSDFFLFSFNKT